MQWQDNLDVNAAYWTDYRSIVNALPGDRFPDCLSLNQLLPNNVRTSGDRPVCFVNSTELEAEDYEYRIFTKGYVSTRPDCWHDLFNAMVWLRFPHIKSAMNALHFRAKPAASGRGRLRDALTLFDECGVLLVSSQADILDAIARRNWLQAFQSQACAWQTGVKAAICGHAMLEKLIAPYKSMTAKALLIKVSPQTMLLPSTELLPLLDKELARLLLAGQVLNKPAQLSPLPLAGIPGWDFAGQQNEDFYNDSDVFRPAPKGLNPAPVLTFDL